MPTTTPNAKRIQTIDIALPAEAGSLARIYSGFREAGVNVIVNIGATDAFAVNGRFASVLFTSRPTDFPTLCKTLGI